MLSSLHAYNKAKKVNCLINSWNIEGFKVFVALRVAQPKGALQKANFAFARLPSGKRTLLFEKNLRFAQSAQKRSF